MNNIVKKVYSDYLRETFYYATHKSGLRIVFVPKKLSTMYAILGVGYGSVDSAFRCNGENECVGIPDGIAHYLEHKMFESEDGSDAFASFSEYGANANAFTTNNLTAYLFSCTSNFEQSLSVLLDFVQKPYFTHENVEKERGIISEEIEMYEDDPYSSLHYGMLELLYFNHPVRINVAGTVESVSRIEPGHLYRCYNAFYCHDNMVLSVSGDTDIETILDICDKCIPCSKKMSVQRARIDEPEQANLKRCAICRPVSQPLFCIGIKDRPDEDSRERAKRSIACSLIMDVLFGSSSEFFTELYSQGIINSMSCGYDCMLNYAFGYLVGEGKDPEKVYSRFSETVNRMLDHGIDRQDFDRMKKVSAASFVKNFDSTESIATDALYMALDGISPHEYADLIFEVDYEYTSEIAKSMFSCEKCVMMTVNPPDKGE